jgi:hypothetical protein
MAANQDHCSFVLLSEFDIHVGAALKYQFPQPLGLDEEQLAMLMLPDGAETQLDDWTMFFLNQRPFNAIAPVLALETSSDSSPGVWREKEGQQDLLCVLNLVRTKHDKNEKRGALVRAMAICTPHPFIQIFKPVLLMAMDHYFNAPSQDCLADLFDAVNSMDLSGAPTLSRQEKIVMRSSERKDLFAEKFAQLQQQRHEEQQHKEIHHHHQQHNHHHQPQQSISASSKQSDTRSHHNTFSIESQNSFEEGFLLKAKKGGRERSATESMVGVFRNANREPNQNSSSLPSRSELSSVSASASISSRAPSRNQNHHHNYNPSVNYNQPLPSPPSADNSFNLGGSAVWVGDDSTLDGGESEANDSTSSLSQTATSTVVSGSTRGRRSTDASSESHSSGYHPSSMKSSSAVYEGGGGGGGLGGTGQKDTHFYHTTVDYKGHKLPIKMPLTTFPEEVGDYTLIPLIKTFSSYQQLSGPQHHHLHTNGPQTHPILILFNALITGKRIIFLGHRRPAGQVSNYVLSACALGSGCGQVLRGYIERAFPYAHLKNKDDWENVPGYIAGVTNPIFEKTGAWDILFNIASGKVMVHDDIGINCPVSVPPALNTAPFVNRTGTVKAESSISSEKDIRDGKGEFGGNRAENADTMFIEDIQSAINFHFGESAVRMRFTEYVIRFVRIAARYESETVGSTQIGYPTHQYSERDGRPTLGSGFIFGDESQSTKELTLNAHRIEGWKRTNTYANFAADFSKSLSINAMRGFDVVHQLQRFRHGKHMPDREVECIMRNLADNVHSYEQVIEVLFLPHDFACPKLVC